MKVSIVTPSYNQGHFIEEAIQSIQRQNYGDFEHIIVDNCSTDQTPSILQKYPHLTVISEPDQGQSDALNKGFKLVTGDIVGWLNADDRYLDQSFNVVTNFFQNNSKVDVVYGNYNWINKKGKLLKKRKELDFDLFMLKYLHTLYIPSTASFFRRKIFDDNNFLDIALEYAMDYDFFIKLALKGYTLKHLDVFLADFRWHQSNKSLQAGKKQFQEKEECLIKHDPYLSSLAPKKQKIIRNLLMYLARSKRYFLKAIKGYYIT